MSKLFYKNPFIYFRTSSASEYSAYRDQNLRKANLSNDLIGSIVISPIISIDDWVPERPPKNPSLRIPSPDLPPPPANHQENDLTKVNQDDPLPPPPPELMRHIRQFSEPDNKFNTASRRNSFAGSTARKSFIKVNHFDNLSPPLLPRKPPAIDLFNQRPFSSMRQPHGFQVTQALAQNQKWKQQQQQTPQPLKAHKVILNGKLGQQQNGNGLNNGTMATNRTIQQSHNDSRTSIRKRTHNAPMPLTERHTNQYNPILPNHQNNQTTIATTKLSPTSKSSKHMIVATSPAPDATVHRSPLTIENRIR